MNQQELEALAVELAGMKCPDCEPDVIQFGLSCDRPRCSTCHGTGYLFSNTVRVPCRGPHSIVEPSQLTGEGANWYQTTGGVRSATCAEVGCRGWTPSLDFVAWCWALAELNISVHVSWRLVHIGKPAELTVFLVGAGSLATKAERLLTALAQNHE